MEIADLIFETAEKAEQNIAVREGDYLGEDGLLHCGACHMPKQCRVEFMGEVKTPMCMCRCDVERYEKEKALRERVEFEEKVRRLRQDAFPDDRASGWTFAQDDLANEQLSKIARAYVDNFSKVYKSGKGLLLCGGCGTGKTFMSACIANALIEKGWACLMTNFSRLTTTMMDKREGRQEYLDRLNDYALLVLDDFAAERGTEWVQEIVTNVIDLRYRAALPLIVTTNLTLAEIQKPKDAGKARIYSRLIEMCAPIEMHGADRRKQAAAASHNELREILGL